MMNRMDFSSTNRQEINLHDIRNVLEDEHARLVQQIHRTLPAEQEAFGRNPDRVDLANSFTSLVERSVRQTMDQKKLTQVEAALRRLEDGLYGCCVGCGTLIAAERLAILPSTTHCVTCQQSAT